MASTSTSVVFIEPLGTSSASENDCRMVRFDNECVLIPEYSPSRRRPRVVTKSYSLPLWKRRSPSLPPPVSDSECTENTNTNLPPPLSTSPEETHVVIRVPIPSFVRRSSRSPSRGSGRSLSTSPTIPLSPCLVHRTSSSPPTSNSALSPTSPTRRSSLRTFHRRPDDQTIPLRACCPDCVPITEECLKKGSTWQEKFTKGAKRRRSASLDSTMTTTTSVGNLVGGKAAFVTGPYNERMPPPTFAITVDEVDKRRKSQDSVHEAHGTRSGSPKGRLSQSQFNGHDREYSGDSFLSDESDPQGERPDPLIPKRKSSPIAEEDENELFPLPSPRRSPSGSRSPSFGPSSPKVSPRASPKSSPGVSPKQSPTPSPNTSSSCLHPSSAAVLAAALKAKSKSNSKDSLGLGSSSSEEVLLNGVISRKSKEKGKECKGSSATADPVDLTPPVSGASTPRGSKPRPLSLTLSFPSARKTSASANGNTDANTTGGDTVPNSPVTPTTVFDSSFNSVSSISSTSQPKSPISPTSPKIPSSPTLGNGNSGKNRKLSFTLPFLKATEAIKGASVDVLRGVSSISGGGGVVGGGM